MARITPPSIPGFDADKIRTKRVTTGSIGGSTGATITVTWDTPFADTNYTATVAVLETTSGATDTLQIRRVVSQTAEAITVRVHNMAPITAHTGTVHAIAIAD